MPIIQADFSESVDLTPLPAGTYKVRVTGCDSKVSQTSGNHYLNWKLETFGREESQLNHRTIFHSTPITGKGAGILKQFLMAAVGEVPGGGNFDTNVVMGRELQVTVDQERDRNSGELTGYVRVKSVARL